MKVRLTEIFTSIEGEGIFCGTKTLFVRLAGCPYGCFYCDTQDSLPLDSGTIADCTLGFKGPLGFSASENLSVIFGVDGLDHLFWNVTFET